MVLHMQQDIPYLHFDFANQVGEKQTLEFTNPYTVIQATKLEEVVSCLETVEAYVDAGYYAAGFVSYEAAPAFDSAFKVHSGGTFPLLWFGIFKETITVNTVQAGNFHIDEWKANVSATEYQKYIKQIKQHIENGETYQVNYTIRLHSRFRGDCYGYYQQLAESQAANYSAYLHIGSYSILSASPELFFHLKDGQITTKPMKGTVKRGSSAREDDELAHWLYHSEKNRAENVMIVDLLRNDLGTIAKPGTVEVPHLFTIERYPTVFQMTSTVTAEVKADIPAIFKALFPCGSITGAPKVSTMKIIHDLEDTPRQIYCGAIGYITPEKEAIFNVPIRTVLIENSSGKAYYGVGGGITWDSTSKGEYDEILTKARFLQQQPEKFDLLETMKLENGSYYLLDYHLQRLAKSGDYFAYPIDLISIQQQLQQIANRYPLGIYKLRLLVTNAGEISIEIQNIQSKTQPIQVAIAKHPIDKANPFYYYKTTNRGMYKAFLNEHPLADDVLLWNADEELTEFTIGNVVVERNGKFYTPPVECGLLAGTFRQYLIDKGRITEKVITLNELDECTNIWLINSVKKWVPVIINS